MKKCRNCGELTALGRMYCPSCGGKLDFVEAEVTQRAAEERKAERISDLQEQFIQWIALTFLVLVVAWCFKDYALRQSGADAPVFFRGPAVVGTGKASDVMVIGRGGGYLELGKSAVRVPPAESLEAKETPENERKEDVIEVTKMSKAATVTVMLKGGKTMHGSLLGKTQTHVVVGRGDKMEVLPAEQVESIQYGAKKE
jgi:translation initiation factor IF-1